MDETRPKNPIGYTDLIGTRGISKSDPRIQLLGAIDEASAALSMAKSLLPDSTDIDALTNCQQDLSHLMSFTARIGTDKMQPEDPGFFAIELVELESVLERLKAQVELPNRFIFPGQSQVTGALDLARVIVRRSERELNAGYDSLEVEAPNARQYINRLSSLCYLLILKFSDLTRE